MDELKSRGSEFLVPEGLRRLSPKFLSMLENVQDPDHKGKHLIYSQFRTIEGIGVFKLVLEQNGYTELKVKRDQAGTGWTLDIEPGKPMYALFTGVETVEHKEVVRKIFNGDWDNFNPSFIAELKAISPNFIDEYAICAYLRTVLASRENPSSHWTGQAYLFAFVSPERIPNS